MIFKKEYEPRFKAGSFHVFHHLTVWLRIEHHGWVHILANASICLFHVFEKGVFPTIRKFSDCMLIKIYETEHEKPK